MNATTIVLALALAAGAAVASPRIVPAPRCPAPSEAWTVARGDLAAGAACGSWIVTTDAGDTRLYIAGLFRHVSLARVTRREPVTAPYELSFDWRWLTAGRWTLEIHGLGVVVLIGRDTIGFYVDDAQMMGDTFEPLASSTTSAPQRITVRQAGREIIVLVDGTEVGRHTLAVAPREGSVTIGLRGMPGERTRGKIATFELRSLTAR